MSNAELAEKVEKVAEENVAPPAEEPPPPPPPPPPPADADTEAEKPAKEAANESPRSEDTSPVRTSGHGHVEIVVEEVGDGRTAEDIEADEDYQHRVQKRMTILDMNYDDSLRDDYMNRSGSDSDMSEDSVGSYVRQKSLMIPPDFFEMLGTVPELSDISEDVSLTDLRERLSRRYTEQVTVELDVGHFVDPVTGEELISEEEPPEVVEEEAAEEEEEEEDEDDELLAAQEVDEDADLDQLPDDDDVFETFLVMEPDKKDVIEDAIDWAAMEREAAARRLEDNTREFIDGLIGRVVEICEYVDPNTLLRENLKKEKLMAELQDRLLEFYVEQRARSFLNRKVVDFFRRKKAFRPITEDAPDVLPHEIHRYKSAVNHLDSVLGREHETQQNSAEQLGQLNAQLYEWQQNSRAHIHTLEELMRKTLIRDNFERLKVVLEDLLGRMAQLRDEVSECRLVLLQRQHTYAVLVEKLDKLEDLGSGLRMRDFEHLQTETQALGKKIEERNAELSKLRTRCNADLHIMAHMKEKQQMIRNTIAIQETALQDLLDEKQYCRERLYSLKLARERARKEMHELSFQGGLLDKPALMMDYDETKDRLDKLRAKVEQMRTKYADVQQRIQAIEKKCDITN